MNEARAYIQYVKDNLEPNLDYFIFAPVRIFFVFSFNYILTKIIFINEQKKIFFFLQCPHEKPCPRYNMEQKTPCNFVVQYENLPIFGPAQNKLEYYSYVVFKKGNFL